VPKSNDAKSKPAAPVLSRILDTDGLAEKFPGTPRGFWEKLRCAGGGPEFLKIGSKVFYEENRVQEWLEARRHASTSELPPRHRRPWDRRKKAEAAA
jgi:hypothetical protein